MKLTNDKDERYTQKVVEAVIKQSIKEAADTLYTKILEENNNEIH